MISTMQLLTKQMGDITLGWTDDQVEMMTEVIQRKMDEGFTFFILDDENREIRLRKIEDLQGRNAVTIGDREAEQLIREGKIGIVAVDDLMINESTDSEPAAKPSRRAKTAREAATSRTVATPRAGGG